MCSITLGSFYVSRVVVLYCSVFVLVSARCVKIVLISSFSYIFFVDVCCFWLFLDYFSVFRQF